MSRVRGDSGPRDDELACFVSRAGDKLDHTALGRARYSLPARIWRQTAPSIRQRAPSQKNR